MQVLEDAPVFALFVTQCVQSLRHAEHWLDKARLTAEQRRFDVDILMDARLAPDMRAFAYQIQSACDYIKGAAAWLSGQVPPRHADDETTIEQLRLRIRKTVAYVESVDTKEFADAHLRAVTLSWKPGHVIMGRDYLAQITVPNVYFHLSMAYAILRHNGVDVGKMDFLGPMRFVPMDQDAPPA